MKKDGIKCFCRPALSARPALFFVGNRPCGKYLEVPTKIVRHIDSAFFLCYHVSKLKQKRLKIGGKQVLKRFDKITPEGTKDTLFCECDAKNKVRGAMQRILLSRGFR